MKSWKLLASMTVCAAMLAGCSSVSLDEENANANANDSRAVLNDPNGELSVRSVYFGFDRYDIQAKDEALINAHAKFLVKNPDIKVVIEGNTDERGGREYNLALGQKRSEAVKQRLEVLGVKDAQVEAISFGKERPVASGSTEEAYAQNRRADIVY